MSDEQLPEMGAIVTVGDGQSSYTAKVESAKPELIWLTLTAESKDQPPPTAGSQITAWWRVGRGQVKLPVAFAGAFPQGELILWRLTPIGQAQVVQRRRYVRVECPGPVVAIFFGGPKSGNQCKGTMIDIGDGGTRCYFPKGEMHRNDVMELEFSLRDEVWINGWVLRTSDTYDGREEVVITFDEVTPQMSDAIRKFVFAKERERRQRESDKEDFSEGSA